MYTVHHDATLLADRLDLRRLRLQLGEDPGLSASASRDKQGKIHVTLCNLNPNAPAELTCLLQGADAKTISGRVLTAPDAGAQHVRLAGDGQTERVPGLQ